MVGKLSVSSKRVVILLSIAAIAACGLVLRFLHLFSAGHYYILSADSYFFDWQAHRILSGESVPMPLHSGLTYPLAYVAKAIGLVFDRSPEEALKIAGLVLSPMLGVLTIIVIYLAVSRIYGKRVGLFSALAWAILGQAVYIQAAGYLDRDGLSILLIMTGALIFALSGDWHWRVHGLDLGWVKAGLAILALEALLMLEWVEVGAFFLTAILLAGLAAEILVLFCRRLFSGLPAEDDPVALAVGLLKRSPGSLADALKTSNWRPVAVITGLSVSVAAARPGLGHLYSRAIGIIQYTLATRTQIVEMQGLSLSDLTNYGILLVPLLIGLYISLRSSRRGDCLCLGWFVGLFLCGLFARRIFAYAMPAGCIISGLGLAYLLQFGTLRLSMANLARALYDRAHFLRYALVGAAVLLLLLTILLGTKGAYHLGSDSRLSADSDWQAALVYLKDNTSESTVIMSWWDYGYWIRDLADRQPVVDNGVHSDKADHDVAVAYVTTEASEVVRIMQKYGADYVIFSKVEYAILPTITKYALGQAYGNGQSIPKEMRDSIYSRSLSGDFQSSGDLHRIYPAPGAEAEVVILARG